MLTVTEAAVQLGVSTRRVRALIQAEQLKANKNAGVWDIDPRSLRALAAKERRPGNPHKKRRPKVQRMDRKPGRPKK